MVVPSVVLRADSLGLRSARATGTPTACAPDAPDSLNATNITQLGIRTAGAQRAPSLVPSFTAPNRLNSNPHNPPSGAKNLNFNANFNQMMSTRATGRDGQSSVRLHRGGDEVQDRLEKTKENIALKQKEIKDMQLSRKTVGSTPLDQHDHLNHSHADHAVESSSIAQSHRKNARSPLIGGTLGGGQGAAPGGGGIVAPSPKPLDSSRGPNFSNPLSKQASKESVATVLPTDFNVYGSSGARLRSPQGLRSSDITDAQNLYRFPSQSGVRKLNGDRARVTDVVATGSDRGVGSGSNTPGLTPSNSGRSTPKNKDTVGDASAGSNGPTSVPLSRGRSRMNAVTQTMSTLNQNRQNAATNTLSSLANRGYGSGSTSYARQRSSTPDIDIDQIRRNVEETLLDQQRRSERKIIDFSPGMRVLHGSATVGNGGGSDNSSAGTNSATGPRAGSSGAGAARGGSVGRNFGTNLTSATYGRNVQPSVTPPNFNAGRTPGLPRPEAAKSSQGGVQQRQPIGLGFNVSARGVAPNVNPYVGSPYLHARSMSAPRAEVAKANSNVGVNRTVTHSQELGAPGQGVARGSASLEVGNLGQEVDPSEVSVSDIGDGIVEEDPSPEGKFQKFPKKNSVSGGTPSKKLHSYADLKKRAEEKKRKESQIRIAHNVNGPINTVMSHGVGARKSSNSSTNVNTAAARARSTSKERALALSNGSTNNVSNKRASGRKSGQVKKPASPFNMTPTGSSPTTPPMFSPPSDPRIYTGRTPKRNMTSSSQKRQKATRATPSGSKPAKRGSKGSGGEQKKSAEKAQATASVPNADNERSRGLRGFSSKRRGVSKDEKEGNSNGKTVTSRQQPAASEPPASESTPPIKAQTLPAPVPAPLTAAIVSSPMESVSANSFSSNSLVSPNTAVSPSLQSLKSPGGLAGTGSSGSGMQGMQVSAMKKLKPLTTNNNVPGLKMPLPVCAISGVSVGGFAGINRGKQNLKGMQTMVNQEGVHQKVANKVDARKEVDDNDIEVAALSKQIDSAEKESLENKPKRPVSRHNILSPSNLSPQNLSPNPLSSRFENPLGASPVGLLGTPISCFRTRNMNKSSESSKAGNNSLNSKGVDGNASPRSGSDASPTVDSNASPTCPRGISASPMSKTRVDLRAHSPMSSPMRAFSPPPISSPLLPTKFGPACSSNNPFNLGKVQESSTPNNQSLNPFNLTIAPPLSSPFERPAVGSRNASKTSDGIIDSNSSQSPGVVTTISPGLGSASDVGRSPVAGTVLANVVAGTGFVMNNNGSAGAGDAELQPVSQQESEPESKPADDTESETVRENNRNENAEQNPVNDDTTPAPAAPDDTTPKNTGLAPTISLGAATVCSSVASSSPTVTPNGKRHRGGSEEFESIGGQDANHQLTMEYVEVGRNGNQNQSSSSSNFSDRCPLPKDGLVLDAESPDDGDGDGQAGEEQEEVGDKEDAVNDQEQKNRALTIEIDEDSVEADSAAEIVVTTGSGKPESDSTKQPRPRPGKKQRPRSVTPKKPQWVGVTDLGRRTSPTSNAASPPDGSPGSSSKAKRRSPGSTKKKSVRAGLEHLAQGLANAGQGNASHNTSQHRDNSQHRDTPTASQREIRESQSVIQSTPTSQHRESFQLPTGTTSKLFRRIEASATGTADKNMRQLERLLERREKENELLVEGLKRGLVEMHNQLDKEKSKVDAFQCEKQAFANKERFYQDRYNELLKKNHILTAELDRAYLVLKSHGIADIDPCSTNDNPDPPMLASPNTHASAVQIAPSPTASDESCIDNDDPWICVVRTDQDADSEGDTNADNRKNASGEDDILVTVIASDNVTSSELLRKQNSLAIVPAEKKVVLFPPSSLLPTLLSSFGVNYRSLRGYPQRVDARWVTPGAEAMHDSDGGIHSNASGSSWTQQREKQLRAEGDNTGELWVTRENSSDLCVCIHRNPHAREQRGFDVKSTSQTGFQTMLLEEGYLALYGVFDARGRVDNEKKSSVESAKLNKGSDPNSESQSLPRPRDLPHQYSNFCKERLPQILFSMPSLIDAPVAAMSQAFESIQEELTEQDFFDEKAFIGVSAAVALIYYEGIKGGGSSAGSSPVVKFAEKDGEKDREDGKVGEKDATASSEDSEVTGKKQNEKTGKSAPSGKPDNKDLAWCVTGHIGDSKIVVGMLEEVAGEEKRTLRAVPLTRDHSVFASNEAEMKRVREAGAAIDPEKGIVGAKDANVSTNFNVDLSGGSVLTRQLGAVIPELGITSHATVNAFELLRNRDVCLILGSGALFKRCSTSAVINHLMTFDGDREKILDSLCDDARQAAFQSEGNGASINAPADIAAVSVRLDWI